MDGVGPARVPDSVIDSSASRRSSTAAIKWPSSLAATQRRWPMKFWYDLAQLAEAINWMKLGAPFVMMPPSPYWKSKPEGADDHS